MPNISSMALFHWLCQDDQKGMQHDIFGHVMTLTSESAPMESSVAPLHSLG